MKIYKNFYSYSSLHRCSTSKIYIIYMWKFGLKITSKFAQISFGLVVGHHLWVGKKKKKNQFHRLSSRHLSFSKWLEKDHPMLDMMRGIPRSLATTPCFEGWPSEYENENRVWLWPLMKKRLVHPVSVLRIATL